MPLEAPALSTEPNVDLDAAIAALERAELQEDEEHDAAEGRAHAAASARRSADQSGHDDADGFDDDEARDDDRDDEDERADGDPADREEFSAEPRDEGERISSHETDRQHPQRSSARDDAAGDGPGEPSARGGRDGDGRRSGGWGARGTRHGETQQTQKTVTGQVMIVNDTPGEECRIAIMSSGARNARLEALFAERASTATQVGNIYKGRVTNVEPAIQAAFVDFGAGQAGFLHISDLHPRYFPQGDGKERVGKKIPRRDRPLIQDALRRGDEVLVQVLKQGIGTKGPTLTSYLSIPGRLIVMMPWMDKSGVSRKVEDEEQRREMRRILDSLELPEGFGFILRTAGFDRTKAELQRDAAYLLRLWKVMDKRMHAVGAPCELYTESDLLIRTIRDVVDSSIDTIVVDSESAFRRANMFLSVVAPRSAPKVLHYDRAVPIFHAFDVERQIELTHASIVPLPSGGALVIDQTEALVAIDVNSGRSRAARDSETNAYQTNIEAVEEIARQLRLRDLGGVIINDLIDMRSAKHRRDIEDRFRQALRTDRAKTTVAPISEFGILEMTRQRMRPSLRKTHYIDCPHCDGHGEIKMPDAVAGDALRRIAHLLHYDRVKRVEMVCSTRVASILLSSRRRAIDELEDRSGKRVEIRISDALALDRVDLYAYDDRGADIDIEKLPAVQPPKLADLRAELPPEEFEDDDEPVSRGGRRRRRRKPAPADATAIALAGGFDDFPDEEGDGPAIPAPSGQRQGAAPRAPHTAPPRPAPHVPSTSSGHAPHASRPAPAGAPGAPDGAAGAVGAEGEGGRRRRRRRRRRGGGGGGAGTSPDASVTSVASAATGSTGSTDGLQSGVEEPAPAPIVPEAPPPVVDEKPRRIFELAKDLGVTSKELIARCNEAEGFDVKNHMAVMDLEQCARIRAWYVPPAPPQPPARTTPPQPAAHSARPSPASAAGTERPAPPSSDDGEGAGDGSREGDGEGGRRRRRRRRRGRGTGNGDGNGGGGGGGASGAANGGAGGHEMERGGHAEAAGHAPPRNDVRGETRHDTRRDDAPRPRDPQTVKPQSVKPQGVKPQPAPMPSPAPSPRPPSPKPPPAPPTPSPRPTPVPGSGSVAPGAPNSSRSSGSPAAPAAAAGFRPLYGAGRSRKISPAAKAAAARREGA